MLLGVELAATVTEFVSSLADALNYRGAQGSQAYKSSIVFGSGRLRYTVSRRLKSLTTTRVEP